MAQNGKEQNKGCEQYLDKYVRKQESIPFIERRLSGI
jgi:hypothetical protein